MRIALIGYGNVGQAVLASAAKFPDIDVAGIVRRENKPVHGYNVVTDIEALTGVEAAILAIPSRLVPETAKDLLRRGISTVDSFDIHNEIASVHLELHAAAVAGNAVSILSAGWDPGLDSILRALLLAAAPQGITHTNFGPGLSMGHSVAVRAIDGVTDALSMTIPAGESRHRRMIYVQTNGQRPLEDIKRDILNDAYFIHDEAHVIEVDDVSAYRSMAHGVSLTRQGASGSAENQLFSFKMQIDNPALTAQMMLSCAYAALRQKPGCYTLIELPVVDLLPGGRDRYIETLV